MYSKKLIDIFLTNFIEGSLNFYGILLIPKKTIHNHLIWSIDNPKDLPWSNSAIKLFITNKIHQFNKLVSGEFVSLSKTINEFDNLIAYNTGGWVSSCFNGRLIFDLLNIMKQVLIGINHFG